MEWDKTYLEMEYISGKNAIKPTRSRKLRAKRRMVEMTCCSDVHKQFDKFANGKVQVGELPERMHVSGKVAWYVFQGPYSELGPKGFSTFWKRFGEAKLKMDGAPGDVYVCSPECHEEDKQTKMLTIIWCPIK